MLITSQRLKKHTIGLLIASLCCPTAPLIAEPAKRPDPQEVRPSGALANAAAAAAAAASAATAAAEAAKAAAAAAAAALGALNAIQRPLPPSAAEPPSEAPAAQPAPAATLTTNSGSKDKPGKNKAQPIPEPDKEEAAVAATGKNGKQDEALRWFNMPAEKTLVGLVGKFEIPVNVDIRSDTVVELWGEKASANLADEADLRQSVAAGLDFSRDVLASSARIDQASAQSGQARAFLLPSLSLKKNRGRENSSPAAIAGNENHIRTDSTVTLRQTLLDLPGLMDWQRREVLVKSKEESHRAARGDAFLSSVNAYLTLVNSRIQAEFSADFESQLEQLLGYIKKRADAGASSSSDEGRVRARVLTAKSSRLEQEAAHAASGLDFFRLTNTAPKIVRLPEVADVGGYNLPKDLNDALSIAMDKNPDMASLRQELRAAEIDKTASLGRFLPRFDMEMTDTATDNAQGNLVNQKDKRLMLVANWNLINGGGDVEYARERKAKIRELEFRLDDQRRKVVQSLSSQYAILKATRDRLVEGYKEMDSLSKAAKSMSQRMLYGNQSLLDLLDVYDRFYQAKSRLATMHMQELQAVAQIARMIEGGADGTTALAAAPASKAPAPAKAGAKDTPASAVSPVPVAEKTPTPPTPKPAEVTPPAKAEAAPMVAPAPAPVANEVPLPAVPAPQAAVAAEQKPKLPSAPIPAVTATTAPAAAQQAVTPAPALASIAPPAEAPTTPASEIAKASPLPGPDAAKAAALPPPAATEPEKVLAAPAQASPAAIPEKVEPTDAVANVAKAAPDKEILPKTEEPLWRRLLGNRKESAPTPAAPAEPVATTAPALPEPVPATPSKAAPSPIKTIFCPPCSYGQECPVCEAASSDAPPAPALVEPTNREPEAPIKRRARKPTLSLSSAQAAGGHE